MQSIIDGLDDLRRVLIQLHIRSVATPPLGCGLGGLDWEQVRPAVEAAQCILCRKQASRCGVVLEWYPRLLHAQAAERTHWRFIGNGEGLHWPDLDEDISVKAVVFGIPSREGRQSLRNWLEEQQQL